MEPRNCKWSKNGCISAIFKGNLTLIYFQVLFYFLFIFLLLLIGIFSYEKRCQELKEAALDKPNYGKIKVVGFIKIKNKFSQV